MGYMSTKGRNNPYVKVSCFKTEHCIQASAAKGLLHKNALHGKEATASCCSHGPVLPYTQCSFNFFYIS
jgi:hypothetical protein